MFNKILGSAAIVGGSVFIGKNMTERLKKRKENLKAFHNALVMLESEINYSANSIDRAFKNISGAVDLTEFFEYVIEEMKDRGIRKAWNSGITKFKTSFALTDDDVKILLTLSSELGITDRENQIKNIRYVLTMLEKAETEADSRYSSLSGLYRNISIGAGLTAAILLM